MRIVGLDLGAKKYAFCEVKEARVVRRATCRGVRELEEVLAPALGPARVAVEACREAWFVSNVLSSWGHEVVLIDTTRVRQLGIGDHGRKTDRIDAEVLALALESRRVPVAHMLSPERQQLRFDLGVRKTLVETRAQYVTTVRHLCRSKGVSLPTCMPGYFVSKLRKIEFDDALRRLVDPLLLVLEQLDVQIHGVDAGLIAIAKSEPLFAHLMTVPGVGVIVAATFISVIDNARRFRNAHEVEAYLGLVPSEYSSGNLRRIGSITKRGNSYARAMLVEAAKHILRHASNDPLSKWGLAVKARRGANVAGIALARRLAGVLWGMWRDGTVYEPARVGAATARGYQRHAQSLELRARALLEANAKLQRRARRTTKIVVKEKS
jgi:transposase